MKMIESIIAEITSELCAHSGGEQARYNCLKKVRDKLELANQIIDLNPHIVSGTVENAEYELIKRLFNDQQRWNIANMFAHKWDLVGVSEFVLATKRKPDGCTHDGWYEDQVIFNVKENHHRLHKDRYVEIPEFMKTKS